MAVIVPLPTRARTGSAFQNSINKNQTSVAVDAAELAFQFSSVQSLSARLKFDTRVRLSAGLSDVTSAALSSRADKKNKNKTAAMTSETTSLPVAESAASQPIRVLLRFKRNVFDPRKQMLQ